MRKPRDLKLKVGVFSRRVIFRAFAYSDDPVLEEVDSVYTGLCEIVNCDKNDIRKLIKWLTEYADWADKVRKK